MVVGFPPEKRSKEHFQPTVPRKTQAKTRNGVGKKVGREKKREINNLCFSFIRIKNIITYIHYINNIFNATYLLTQEGIIRQNKMKTLRRVLYLKLKPKSMENVKKLKHPILPLMTRPLAVSLIVGGGYYALCHKRISSR